MFSQRLGSLHILWLTPTVQRHVNPPLQQKQTGCSMLIGLQVALLHFFVVKNRHSGNAGGLIENKDMFSPEHRIWRELSLIDDSELSVGVNVNVSICLYAVYQPCDEKAT